MSHRGVVGVLAVVGSVVVGVLTVVGLGARRRRWRRVRNGRLLEFFFFIYIFKCFVI